MVPNIRINIWRRPLYLLIFAAVGLVGCQQQTESVTQPGTNTQSTQTIEAESQDSEPMKILVYASTGKQGRIASKLLVDAGFNVRGSTRNLEGEHALDLANYGVEMVYSDFDDAQSIEAAVTGVDGLYLIVPSALGHDDLGYARRVIEPAEKAGVEHLVYLSYLSADPDVGYEKAPKQLTENFIREEQNIPYTIIRSVEFMEDFNEWWKDEILENGFADPKDDDFLRQFIAGKDLAGFMVRAFQNPDEWKGNSIGVAGDEMTNVELAAIVSRVVGREVPFKKITWEEWHEDYGIPMPIVEIWKWYNESRLAADIEALKEDYPDLQSLEDFLRETGWEDY